MVYEIFTINVYREIFEMSYSFLIKTMPKENIFGFVIEKNKHYRHTSVDHDKERRPVAKLKSS
jgi:hypothetical protein